MAAHPVNICTNAARVWISADFEMPPVFFGSSQCPKICLSAHRIYYRVSKVLTGMKDKQEALCQVLLDRAIRL